MHSIATIVEGESEVQSVPVLLRRQLGRLARPDINVAKPFRVHRNRVVKAGELERAILQVIRSRENVAGLLIILDADDDPAAQLENELHERCTRVTELPCRVVVAVREFESWFLAAKESLRGERGIRLDALPPENPEAIRGAKERLTANMSNNRRYIETDDQPALVEKMDFEAARTRCPSFERLLSSVADLVDAAT
jgi:hypothetical protein